MEFIEFRSIRWKTTELEIVLAAGESIVSAFKNEKDGRNDEEITRLETLFHDLETIDRQKPLGDRCRHFSEKTALIYELLALHDALEELGKIL
jgi:hypothetical protein